MKNSLFMYLIVALMLTSTLQVIIPPSGEPKTGSVKDITSSLDAKEIMSEKSELGMENTRKIFWTLTGGGDHCREDWIPDDESKISGIHSNINNFIVETGTTIYIQETENTDFGYIEIYANQIIINGTINASNTVSVSTSGAGGSGWQQTTIRGGGGGGGYGGEGGSGGGGIVSGGGGNIHCINQNDEIDKGAKGGKSVNQVLGGRGGGSILLWGDKIILNGFLINNGEDGQSTQNSGGSGGGKARLAQAGGKHKDKIDEALRLVKGLI